MKKPLGYMPERLGHMKKWLGYIPETLGYMKKPLGYMAETLGRRSEHLGRPPFLPGKAPFPHRRESPPSGRRLLLPKASGAGGAHSGNDAEVLLLLIGIEDLAGGEDVPGERLLQG
ncbi:MAG TPA: hypothetical protein VFR31_17425, partial [Thermoanaerobaculia bacterium]|nr:hypothetical protein [Thermoanaerobaculia bacterium]